MDRDVPRGAVRQLAEGRAQADSASREIKREYTLEEIAIMTRAAPAKLLGLTDRGHLGAGRRSPTSRSIGTIADREAMFVARGATCSRTARWS